jgi:hypothetical protein
MSGHDTTIASWIDEVVNRHASALPRPQFLKAVRALSARYVERRATLTRQSPLDSAGKRAAFAGFFAPLHFLTTQRIAAALGPGPERVDAIVDLGCGTGVTGAAVALDRRAPPPITGIDAVGWALTEARDTWRRLRLDGRGVRANLVPWLRRYARPSVGQPDRRTMFVAGWALNELSGPDRVEAIGSLGDLAKGGVPILVIEPVARSAAPWWDEWARRAADDDGRMDEWRFEEPLPPRLAAIDQEAGFDRDALTARSVALNWR